MTKVTIKRAWLGSQVTLHKVYTFPALRVTGLDADRLESVFRLFVLCVELWGGKVSGGPVLERKATK